MKRSYRDSGWVCWAKLSAAGLQRTRWSTPEKETALTERTWVWRIGPRFGAFSSMRCGDKEGGAGPKRWADSGWASTEAAAGPASEADAIQAAESSAAGAYVVLPSQPGLHQPRAPADFCSWRVHSARRSQLVPAGAVLLGPSGSVASRMFGGVFRRVVVMYDPISLRS